MFSDLILESFCDTEVLMLYTLNVCGAVCQGHLSNTGKEWNRLMALTTVIGQEHESNHSVVSRKASDTLNKIQCLY